MHSYQAYKTPNALYSCSIPQQHQVFAHLTPPEKAMPCREMFTVSPPSFGLKIASHGELADSGMKGVKLFFPLGLFLLDFIEKCPIPIL